MQEMYNIRHRANSNARHTIMDSDANNAVKVCSLLFIKRALLNTGTKINDCNNSNFL